MIKTEEFLNLIKYMCVFSVKTDIIVDIYLLFAFFFIILTQINKVLLIFGVNFGNKLRQDSI